VKLFLSTIKASHRKRGPEMLRAIIYMGFNTFSSWIEQRPRSPAPWALAERKVRERSGDDRCCFSSRLDVSPVIKVERP
jgi:hypothetical protein